MISSVVIEPGSVHGSPGCEPLNVCHRFGNYTAPHFTVTSGNFGFVSTGGNIGTQLCTDPVSSPQSAYTALATFQRNTSVFSCCETDCRKYVLTADLKILPSVAQRNGFVFVAWQENNGIEQFIAAMVDLTDNTFKIVRFNGAGFVVEATSPAIPVAANTWYVITLAVSSPHSAHTTTGRVSASISQPGSMVPFGYTLTVDSATFAGVNAFGLPGVGSFNSVCYFDGFELLGAL